MDHIMEHADINIPTSYISKYINLLLKHFSIVSIDKSDLGRVKHFFHKIHLKDNEPVYRKQFKYQMLIVRFWKNLWLNG